MGVGGCSIVLWLLGHRKSACDGERVERDRFANGGDCITDR